MDMVSMVFRLPRIGFFLPNVCGARKILSSDDTLHACDRTVRAPLVVVEQCQYSSEPVA
jgi:hypothetical protein